MDVLNWLGEQLTEYPLETRCSWLANVLNPLPKAKQFSFRYLQKQPCSKQTLKNLYQPHSFQSDGLIFH